MSSLWLSYKNIFDNINIKNKLDDNLETNICIIGAGIFGITCGYYLSKLGFKVTILEKDFISSKTTGYTTAKITSQHGLFYDYLANSYSSAFAKDYLYVNELAIKNIKNIIDDENINCDFEYQNSFVYTTKNEEIDIIKKEYNTLIDLGYKPELVTKTGLPFPVKIALCFKNQAQFNPVKYLAFLSKSIIDNGGEIYENTTAKDLKSDFDNLITFTDNNYIKSKYVIIATHYPFINFPGFYFTKMYQSSSYIIGVDTKKALFNGMYISAKDPIYSFRTAKFNNNSFNWWWRP